MRIGGLLPLIVAVAAVPSLRAMEPGPAWTPELAFKVKRVGPVKVSPDGRRVAFVVATAVMEGERSEWLSQIRVAQTDGSGSLQLTAGEKAATAPAWSPDGRMVVYPRQPHGIQEPRLQLDAMTRNLEWFDRWVMGKTSPPAAGTP